MYRILIIEDDLIIRNELKLVLEQNGYIVETLECFHDVIPFVFHTNPQLILLDLNLPVHDGFYICNEIRKESNIPIVVVTSRNSEMDEVMSMNLGADHFITKPYNVQILLAKISAILGRVYNVQTSRVLYFEGLSLDMGKGIAIYQGKSTELTKNELLILKLLLENKTAIVSRDKMMNALWQTNSFIDDNTLTVNVNRLRNKLMGIDAVRMIKTHRGLGYSL